MEHLRTLFEPIRGGARRSRMRELEQERAVAEAPIEPRGERGLSGHVPSPLISTDERVRALIVGGAPAWSRRLKKIDTLTDAALEQLAGAWRALAMARQREPARFAAEWREHAARFDFSQVNELIARHNLHFPTEARLAMDVRTRDYIGPGGGDYRRRPLDAAWILDRFPPRLSAALGSQRR